MTKTGKIGPFPLRLPRSLRQQAMELAQREGVSLNHFIALAVAEKISRMDALRPPEILESPVSA